MPIVKDKEFPTVRVSSLLNDETTKCAAKVVENRSEYIRKAVEMRNERVRKSGK